MIVTTTENVPGKKITQVLGIARGNAIRSRGAAGDFIAGVEKIFGGEITAYLKIMTEAREESLQRLIKDAERMGADAVVTVRFQSSEIMTNVAEVFAYGTAVKLG